MTAIKPKKSHPWSAWNPGKFAREQLPECADSRVDYRTGHMRKTK